MSSEIQEQAQAPVIEKIAEHPLPAHATGLALDPSGPGRVFVSCIDGGVYAVQRSTGEAAEIARHESFASGVHALPDGGEVVSAGYDGRLLVSRADGSGLVRVVEAHGFWSWQSSLSPCGGLIASATGRYACGGFRYEPAPEREPSVKVFDSASGGLVHAFGHVPPVESVAFSRDGRHLAAGNLMGEVRVWEIASGAETARFSTGSFTGWGIIKGHYFTGGVFAIAWGPGDQELWLAGMGTTRDPAAGNGKQLWERYALDGAGGATLVSSARDGEIGEGLMETLAFRPGDRHFAMAGRLFKGKWNLALFERESGALVASADTGMRFSNAAFDAAGETLVLAGGIAQKRDGNGGFEPFGRLVEFSIT